METLTSFADAMGPVFIFACALVLTTLLGFGIIGGDY